MNWHLEEAIEYYKTQGAPRDQSALISLFKEVQKELGFVPGYALTAAAESYGVKESFLQAVVRRIPSLRLDERHILRLCAGPNCGKHTQLARCAETLAAQSGGKIRLEFGSCMRLCGKGPNIQWDGKIYHKATEALLRQLAEEVSEK